MLRLSVCLAAFLTVAGCNTLSGEHGAAAIYVVEANNAGRVCKRTIPSYSAKEIADSRGRLATHGWEISLDDFERAMERGDVQDVRDFLVHGLNLNDPFEHDGRSIKESVRYGQQSDSVAQIVQLLVSHGARINDKQYSMLVEAAENGRGDIVQYLIEQCADVNIRTKEFEFWNLSRGGADTPLTAAANARSIEVVRLLLKHGANPNAPGRFGLSPLHSAATSQLDIVKALVEAGADARETRKDGWTPVMAAASFGRYEIISYLIENGANLTSVARDGNSAMGFARRNKRSDIEDLLRANGARN